MCLDTLNLEHSPCCAVSPALMAERFKYELERWEKNVGARLLCELERPKATLAVSGPSSLHTLGLTKTTDGQPA